MLSHPTRGAWIEINPERKGSGQAQRSHPTRGAWIEISTCSHGLLVDAKNGRTPHGVRGLKCHEDSLEVWPL